MRPLVIGSREDVAGFALAGVAGVICARREEADQAIARADADTLFIVSSELGVGDRQLAGDRLCIVVPPTGRS